MSKLKPHNFIQRKTLYKPYCRNCGLVWLGNRASEVLRKKLCKYAHEEDEVNSK